MGIKNTPIARCIQKVYNILGGDIILVHLE